MCLVTFMMQEHIENDKEKSNVYGPTRDYFCNVMAVLWTVTVAMHRHLP